MGAIGHHISNLLTYYPGKVEGDSLFYTSKFSSSLQFFSTTTTTKKCIVFIRNKINTGSHYRYGLKGTNIAFITMMPLVTLLRANSAEWRGNRQGWIEEWQGAWKMENGDYSSPNPVEKFVVCKNEMRERKIKLRWT